jgi:hypothetical protein
MYAGGKVEVWGSKTVGRQEVVLNLMIGEEEAEVEKKKKERRRKRRRSNGNGVAVRGTTFT